MKKGPAETAWGRELKRGHQRGGWSPESLGAGLGHVVAFCRCQGRPPPLSRDPSTVRAPRRDEDRPQREPRCSSPGGLGAGGHLDRPWGAARDSPGGTG